MRLLPYLLTLALLAPSAARGYTPGSRADTLPLGAQALINAYPDFITGYSDNKILFADGTALPYDDGIEKDFDELLDNSDIEDMFSMHYPGTTRQPEYLEDAGRSRNEALFKKMYGADEAAVRRSLVSVPWFGGKVKMTALNGAADSLRKVFDELSKMPGARPYLKSSGTFYWRKVRGANRLSAHSYGIAFDIGVDKADYWKWKNPKAAETDKIDYANRIPLSIVEAFERHGFIWGGAWYHFDTMHFEFRPEILEYRRLKQRQEP